MEIESEMERTVGNAEPAVHDARALEHGFIEPHLVGDVEYVGDLIFLQPQRILRRAGAAQEEPSVDGRRAFAAVVGRGWGEQGRYVGLKLELFHNGTPSGLDLGLVVGVESLPIVESIRTMAFRVGASAGRCRASPSTSRCLICRMWRRVGKLWHAIDLERKL